MNVICPLCKGPATQPIMEIYCKNECSRPKVTSSTLENRSGLLERHRLNAQGQGFLDYEIWKSPPPDRYINSLNYRYSWIDHNILASQRVPHIASITTWWKLTEFNYWKDPGEYSRAYCVIRVEP